MLGSLYSVAPQGLRSWPVAGAVSQTPSGNNAHPSSMSDGHRRQNRAQTTTANRFQSTYASHAGNVLPILSADEAAMAARKLNISRFGATWLRPAGVPKTLQAMQDEETERAELAEQERRARVLAEETAAAEEAARRALGDRNVDGAGEDRAVAGILGEEMERDLDAEVPDAEEGATYNEEDGENEADLDEDIPEAGSYQHTDTDVEDPASDLDDEIHESSMMETTEGATMLTQDGEYSLNSHMDEGG